MKSLVSGFPCLLARAYWFLVLHLAALEGGERKERSSYEESDEGEGVWTPRGCKVGALSKFIWERRANIAVICRCKAACFYPSDGKSRNVYTRMRLNNPSCLIPIRVRNQLFNLVMWSRPSRPDHCLAEELTLRLGQSSQK